MFSRISRLFHAPSRPSHQYDNYHLVTQRSYQHRRENSNIRSISQKDRQYSSKYRFSVLQTTNDFLLEKPSISINSSRFYLKCAARNPKTAKYRSKYCQNPCYSRQKSSFLHPNVTNCVWRPKNPEYDENINYQLPQKTEVGRKDNRERARRAKKENPEKKKYFSFIFFLFTN